MPLEFVNVHIYNYPNLILYFSFIFLVWINNETNFFLTFNCRNAIAASSFDVNLYPNPADGELTVSFNAVKQSAFSIKLNDIIGKTVLTNTGIAEKGENNFRLSLEEIGAGVYFVEIKNDGQSKVLKLVVN